MFFKAFCPYDLLFYTFDIVHVLFLYLYFESFYHQHLIAQLIYLIQNNSIYVNRNAAPSTQKATALKICYAVISTDFHIALVT